MALMLPVAAAVVVAVVVAVVLARLLAPPPLPDGVPQLRGVPGLGSLLGFIRDAQKFLASNGRAGSAFACHLVRQPVLFVTNCMDFPYIFKHGDRFSFIEIGIDISAGVAGVQRDRLHGARTPYIMALFAKHLQGAGLAKTTQLTARALLAEAPSGLEEAQRRAAAAAGVPLYDLCSRVLFRAGVGVVMGADLDTDALLGPFRDFDKGFPLMTAGLPRVLLRSAYAGRDAIRTLVRDQIRRARLLPADGRPAPEIDSLPRGKHGMPAVSPLQYDRLLHFHEGGVLDEDDMAGLSALMLWALHANTGPAGFWMLAHLLASPAALAAVRREIDALFVAHPSFPEGDPTTMPLTSAELDAALPAVTSAAWEALRLTASSFGLRVVTEAAEVPLAATANPPQPARVAHVRPGDRIFLATTHHEDAAIFANPTEFQFDRFMPDPRTGAAPVFHKDGAVLRSPVLPFGGGATLCPGRFLALNEMRLFVVAMLRTWELELMGPLPTVDRTRAGLGVLPPVGDVMVRLRPRTSKTV